MKKNIFNWVFICKPVTTLVLLLKKNFLKSNNVDHYVSLSGRNPGYGTD